MRCVVLLLSVPVLFVLVVETGCGRIGSVEPNIVQGRQFAQWVQFPARFLESKSTKGMFLFNYYVFRTSPKSPDVILVAACRESSNSEICSTNSFAIDTKSGYRTRPTEMGEWEQGRQIKSQEMDNPLRRTLWQQRGMPAFLKAIPIAPGQGREYQGYKYRGNEYPRRGDWVGSLRFAHSEDGSLIALAGADKRRFPDQDAASVAAAVYAVPWGLVNIDVFASDPSHHLAVVDLNCHTSVDTALHGVSLVGSRWLAIVMQSAGR